MTEVGSESADSAGGAGALLRAARERQGLHIAALAASIKITPRKLEALEGNRFDELPDATFTRALALTVCRALKIDPAPVLERLPQGGPTGLGPATGGLNTPFKERPGHVELGSFTLMQRPLIWGAVLVLLAAVGLYLAPVGWWDTRSGDLPAAIMPPLPASAADFAAAPASAAVDAVDAAASSPVAVQAPAAVSAASAVVAAMPAAPAASAAPVVASLLALSASDPSWVEVVDARGQILLSRTLQRGETVTLDGEVPVKLRIGNATALQLNFRGKPVDLAPHTVNSIARLQLN